ncbi:MULTISPECIES: hypothetical protein [Pectobacterium]|uniref:Uncharacterized protein n=1 Tax=Pectobacterium aquaticum TaxID=2204145 RepID=A0AA93DKD4_9GAMM|nr:MULTISPECIES: hypothetical protein [Pectobacterium]RRO10838.1 hypothetical protein DMB84_020230 [Pectobacterium aquaticum]RYC37152.1 hypothetical protein DEH81_21940 [Pectobacterium zantedeschiae]TAJ01844.1 hypothetical protein EG334_22005 [Pectobacterium versatile]
MHYLKKIEENIFYTRRKIDYLMKTREEELIRFYNAHLRSNYVNYPLPEESQILSDAILQSFATLIDYYFIWVALKLGCEIESIKEVQYNSFSDRKFIHTYSEIKKIQFNDFGEVKKEIENELVKISGLECSEIDISRYWSFICKYAICSEMKKWGRDFKNLIQETESDCDNIVNDKVYQYYHYLSFFFCYSCGLEGARYNIYFSLNNYLKHNTVPNILPKVLTFDEERRIYSYFEIKNDYSYFLRDGLLKDILLCDFEKLKTTLDSKSLYKKREIEHEEVYEDPLSFHNLISVDVKNGHFNESDGLLFFFIDGVSFVKTKTSILIDAHYSLNKTTNDVFDRIESCMKLKFHDDED